MNLKFSAMGLVGVAAVLLLPGSFGMQDTSETNFWGAAYMVAYDAEGNEMFAQQIHNRILNAGEEFILDQVFDDDTNSVLDGSSVGVICAFGNGTSGVSDREGVTVTDFDADNSITPVTHCQEDETTTGGDGTAVIGPITFEGNIEVQSGGLIEGIGICQSEGTGTTEFDDCGDGGPAADGILFALVDTSDVTLNAGETVDITYTFDITSDNN